MVHFFFVALQCMLVLEVSVLYRHVGWVEVVALIQVAYLISLFRYDIEGRENIEGVINPSLNVLEVQRLPLFFPKIFNNLVGDISSGCLFSATDHLQNLSG